MILEIFADNLKKKDQSQHKYRSSRAIIKKDQKVLLLYSKKLDYYMLPGGRIEPGESPQECIIREVKEETGYHVKALAETLVIKEYFDDSTWESHFFLCELTDEQPISPSLTDEEHYLDIELKWFDSIDALTLLDTHDSSFSKASNIMQREFLALTNSL
jgi:8-oxo-dGTP pyrophosphatase MutT (NUDIX family)